MLNYNIFKKRTGVSSSTKVGDCYGPEIENKVSWGNAPGRRAGVRIVAMR